MRVCEVPVDDLLDLRRRVLRPDHPPSAARFDGDDRARHFCLTDGQSVLAVASVMTAPAPEPLPQAPLLQLRGMAVEPDLQGRGLGGQLLEGLQDLVAAPLWCNARQRAIPFYEAHRWVRHGDLFEIPSVGPHLRMSWAPLSSHR